MPVIPLATRSQHVDFAYDQVVIPHRSYRPSDGLPRGKPRTRHMWICLQLSGARGVDNGGVIGSTSTHINVAWKLAWEGRNVAWKLAWEGRNVAWKLAWEGRNVALKLAWEGRNVAWKLAWEGRNVAWKLAWEGRNVALKLAWEGRNVALKLAWEGRNVAWKLAWEGRNVALKLAWEGRNVAWKLAWEGRNVAWKLAWEGRNVALKLAEMLHPEIQQKLLIKKCLKANKNRCTEEIKNHTHTYEHCTTQDSYSLQCQVSHTHSLLQRPYLRKPAVKEQITLTHRMLFNSFPIHCMYLSSPAV